MADIPARLFLCARCRDQVVLCSHCDRGQLYCGRACSAAARRSNQLEAGQRYQRSAIGRLKHAARQQRWRQRQREHRTSHVTHQGSLDAGGTAPLPPCSEPVDPRHDAVLVAASAVKPDGLTREPHRCCRCAKVLPPWLRQGFLRRRRTSAGAHLTGWPPRPRGHSP